MDIKVEQIKQLVQMMVDNDLNEVEIALGDDKVSLKRGKPAPAMAPMAMAPLPAAPAVAPAAPAAPAAPKVDSNLVEIRSPMVGTFYAAPSPDSDPFVKVGASVSESTTVCIVEAMKVMNSINSEVSGTIAEVCVRNAQPVEYGQVLFRVKPV
jgi:acetyl-CoA carboxylase biotin carboxyl carrier protein